MQAMTLMTRNKVNNGNRAEGSPVDIRLATFSSKVEEVVDSSSISVIRKYNFIFLFVRVVLALYDLLSNPSILSRIYPDDSLFTIANSRDKDAIDCIKNEY